jgi:hypothetical protein
MKKYDPALYLVLAALLAASLVNAYLTWRGDGDLYVEVTLRGRVVASEPLKNTAGAPMRFGEPGNVNEITICDGVRMTSADCPGGDCLKMGVIRRAGETIACVPHGFAARVSARAGPGVDTVSY